jgi:CheY-like chemotaxis protein
MSSYDPTPVSSFEADSDGEPLVQTPAGARVHVLIADDNDTNRKVLAGMCDLFDCSSFLAKDGVEAVEAFFTMPFDVILMDIEMPRMDGIEAARTIRAGSEYGRRVPIVAVTAHVDPSDLRRYADAGINRVVPKPIEASRLLETISTAVGASLTRRPQQRPC